MSRDCDYPYRSAVAGACVANGRCLLDGRDAAGARPGRAGRCRCPGRLQEGVVVVLSKAVEDYMGAASAVSDVVERIGPDSWDGPGLGGWDLRSLVGHTSRALVTVLTYLHRTAEHADLATPEAYS